MLSSIFEEKIEFDGEKYRTPKYKEGFGYIYQKIKELQGVKKEKGDKLSNVSRLVHYAVNLSNSFIEDLEKVGKFYEKHKEYIRSNSKKTLEEA